MAGDEFFSNHFSNTSESAAISANEVRLFGAVHSVSSQLGRPVYLVGGYVRDMLLGRPNNDIDFVTLGGGIEFANAVAMSLGVSKVAVFKNFGGRWYTGGRPATSGFYHQCARHVAHTWRRVETNRSVRWAT